MFQDASRCFKMFQDVSRCFKMFQDVSRCFKMFQDVSRCFKMFQDVSSSSLFSSLVGIIRWLLSGWVQASNQVMAGHIFTTCFWNQARISCFQDEAQGSSAGTVRVADCRWVFHWRDQVWSNVHMILHEFSWYFRYTSMSTLLRSAFFVGQYVSCSAEVSCRTISLAPCPTCAYDWRCHRCWGKRPGAPQPIVKRCEELISTEFHRNWEFLEALWHRRTPNVPEVCCWHWPNLPCLP